MNESISEAVAKIADGLNAMTELIQQVAEKISEIFQEFLDSIKIRDRLPRPPKNLIGKYPMIVHRVQFRARSRI